MSLYDDSKHAVGDDIVRLHADELASFTQAGTWGTASQRNAVAQLARATRIGDGVNEGQVAANGDVLSDAVARVVCEVARGAVGVDRAFFQAALADGITEPAYVELVGVVARLVNLDVFARGLGVPLRELGEPVADREPSFERPEEAKQEGFFTASVPSAPEGGALAESIYGNRVAANISRSVSLVPAEARRVNRLIKTQYLRDGEILSFERELGHALNRSQVELIATRVSAHHQCFY